MSMEVGFDVEDDDGVFFADLNKQISLLIMDDEEQQDSFPHCPPLSSLQGMSQAIHPTTQASILYEPSWRRESKGTGVFIPRSSQNPTRKKNRKGNHNSSNHHMQFETVRRLRQRSSLQTQPIK